MTPFSDRDPGRACERLLEVMGEDPPNKSIVFRPCRAFRHPLLVTMCVSSTRLRRGCLGLASTSTHDTKAKAMRSRLIGLALGEDGIVAGSRDSCVPPRS